MFYAHRSDRFKFIMCTNGRCGSTWLKQWFLKIHGKALPAPGDFGGIHSSLPYEAEDLHVERSKFNGHPYFKFILVRNPWERLVSFYKTWVVANQINHEKLGRDSSFEMLVSQLENKGFSDAHVFPQFEGLEGLSFDKVVYLESLESDMQEVCRACNIDLDQLDFSDRLFSSLLVEGKPIKEVYRATGHEIVESEHWPDWKNFYNEDLRSRVAKLYEMDIKSFGYRWPRTDSRVEFGAVEKEESVRASSRKIENSPRGSSRKSSSRLRK
jgi:hypothetical protein